ncbi:DDE-type integrase/transposase/recombinase [Pasteurella multocida]|uniref:DDE-type integrase/transposase/recombinase n=1 Tax=Pasteurella multocida TaxID=747 RepID=UPI001C3F1F87|nr:DDE-type integrase/transposase/recombinase [Pasteurella multocida]MDY0632856.1 DDE-type integrase/transposase/recombinase [Pasteurella multocida]
MLRINNIYCYQEEKFRILSETPNGYIWINIASRSALPEFIEYSLIRNLIEEGLCYLGEDPFKNLISYVEKDAKKISKRDANFELIKPIISHDEYYKPQVRGELINEILATQKTTKQTIYRHLRNFWQKGQIPNALLPNYTNKPKDGTKRKIGDKKLGRPRLYSDNGGIVIDEGIKKLFNLVINQYLLNKNKHTIAHAYRMFLLRYKSLYANTDENNIPTIWQFKYFYDKEYSQSERLIRRTDKKTYNKDIRQLKSTVNTHILGSGSKYEIDATIADIYLLSDSDRQSIVGRPIVYLVVDSFSRMVAGFYIGFENPSYVTAMQAFKNAIIDKTEICKKFDIKISNEDWPCIGLPEAILADRGELLGSQVEILEKNFSIRIENTPAYRGDMKGIVERYFRTIQASFKPFTTNHGLVQGIKQVRRGGHDYRYDATLTISDFTKIILNSILIHNNTQQLTKYDREPDMPPDMPLIPIEIWNWGIQNRTGKLRTVDAEVLSVALLPRKKATLSDLGLKVFGVYYQCKKIAEKGWLHRKSSVNRPKSIQVGYELGDASKIYVFYEDNSLDYWEASLSDRSREFEGCSWWEVWQIQAIQKNTAAKQSTKSSLLFAELEKQSLEILERAKKLKNPSQDTKKNRIARINHNRNTERDNERNAIKQATIKKNSPKLKVINNKIKRSEHERN